MEGSINLSDIESFEYINYDCDVYDIEMQDNHNYILSQNYIVHNSSKTWDFFHFLVAFCDNNRNTDYEIYMYRDTLTNCRDFTLKEFQKCLKIIGVYDPNMLSGYGQKPVYNLFGNYIYFRGLDEDIEAQPSDICFFNESLEMKSAPVKNILMRCRIMGVFDWNPKYTDHWCFDLEGQPNTFFTRTTYKNNKHLEQTIIEGIESWCPWMLEDIHLPISERRPNQKNILAGTVDKFRWLVYGEGIRAAMEGLIFDNVKYVDSLPSGYSDRYFGLDFGNTTGIWAFSDNRKVDVDGKINIFYDCPIYSSFDTVQSFYEVFKTYYNKTHSITHWLVICDCAAPQFINDLNMMASNDVLECSFLACKKFEGCVEWRIDLMKRNGINLVNRAWIKKEQENYFWDSANGIHINRAKKDGHDHFFDSAGMSIQYAIDLR